MTTSMSRARPSLAHRAVSEMGSAHHHVAAGAVLPQGGVAPRSPFLGLPPACDADTLQAHVASAAAEHQQRTPRLAASASSSSSTARRGSNDAAAPSGSLSCLAMRRIGGEAMAAAAPRSSNMVRSFSLPVLTAVELQRQQEVLNMRHPPTAVNAIGTQPSWWTPEWAVPGAGPYAPAAVPRRESLADVADASSSVAMAPSASAMQRRGSAVHAVTLPLPPAPPMTTGLGITKKRRSPLAAVGSAKPARSPRPSPLGALDNRALPLRERTLHLAAAKSPLHRTFALGGGDENSAGDYFSATHGSSGSDSDDEALTPRAGSPMFLAAGKGGDVDMLDIDFIHPDHLAPPPSLLA